MCLLLTCFFSDTERINVVTYADPITTKMKCNERETPLRDQLCGLYDSIKSAMTWVKARERKGRSAPTEASKYALMYALEMSIDGAEDNQDTEADPESGSDDSSEEGLDESDSEGEENSDEQCVHSDNVRKSTGFRARTGRYHCHCGKSYSTRDGLTEHALAHLEGDESRQPYKCSKCDKRFTSKQVLKNHERTHFSLDDPRRKRFKCDTCGKRLSTSSTLRKHKLAHQREKGVNLPYACDSCDKSFVSKQYLKTHMLSHLPDDDPLNLVFECEVCNKRLCSAFSLENHQRSHLVDEKERRPFECDECGQRFSIMRILQRHKKKHLPDSEKLIPCEVCGKRLTENAFYHHKKTHLDENDPLKRRFN
ncbi:hypothetical protein PMAYCL1PPCAC_27651 [Pristionchus mayeri]|uniref:C2H2-type domain-containing protein n=1 Tax=Pristionchus mayeri TaxID=1317129 RepID=A0AAN5D5V8_9BILA|nr:hypothetical protein PMAYCL1PPCAC_27651 [Pristionchus mayeri]